MIDTDKLIDQVISEKVTKLPKDENFNTAVIIIDSMKSIVAEILREYDYQLGQYLNDHFEEKK